MKKLLLVQGILTGLILSGSLQAANEQQENLAAIKTQLVRDFLQEKKLDRLVQEHKDYYAQDHERDFYADAGELLAITNMLSHVQEALDAHVRAYNTDNPRNPLAAALLEQKQGIDQTIRSTKQISAEIVEGQGSQELLELVRSSPVEVFDRFVELVNAVGNQRARVSASVLAQERDSCTRQQSSLSQENQECVRERTVLTQKQADLAKKETRCSDELMRLKGLNARYEEDIRLLKQEIKELKERI